MKKLIVVLIGVLLAGCLIFVGTKANNTNKTEEVTDATFEVLDESLLSEDTLKTWLEENSKEEGVYWTVKDDYTYVMITYGETDKSNINICLEEIKPGTNTDLKYSIINEYNHSETVEKYTPKMILKINTPVKNVNWEKVENE